MLQGFASCPCSLANSAQSVIPSEAEHAHLAACFAPPLRTLRLIVTKSGSTPKAESMGSRDRAILARPNVANTCPKEKQSRKDIGLRTGQENDMSVNQKLTNVVKDRVVQHIQLNASELLISFVDGSTMTVTIAECNSPPLHEGARIRQISGGQAKILFECEDDSTLDVTIVDPGNSVIVGIKRWGRVSRVSCGKVLRLSIGRIFLDASAMFTATFPLLAQQPNRRAAVR
jgi:hypothetical protein